MTCPLPAIGDQLVTVPRWTYRTSFGWGTGTDWGVCSLRVWESADAGKVAVMTELPDNPGASITNAAEVILPVLASLWPGPLVTFEHYHHGWASTGPCETLSRVYLAGHLAQFEALWPVSPQHPDYEAHALWAAVYFEEITGFPPDLAALT